MVDLFCHRAHAVYAPLNNCGANIKCFGDPRHQRPDFDGFIYINYTVPPYSARIDAIYLPPSVWQSLVDFRLLTSVSLSAATKLNAEFTEAGYNSDPILCRLWTKVHEIFRPCRRPFVFFNVFAPLSIGLSRLVQKIFAVKPGSRRKTEQMYKAFGSCTIMNMVLFAP